MPSTFNPVFLSRPLLLSRGSQVGGAENGARFSSNEQANKNKSHPAYTGTSPVSARRKRTVRSANAGGHDDVRLLEARQPEVDYLRAKPQSNHKKTGGPEEDEVRSLLKAALFFYSSVYCCAVLRGSGTFVHSFGSEDMECAYRVHGMDCFPSPPPTPRHSHGVRKRTVSRLLGRQRRETRRQPAEATMALPFGLPSKSMP